MDCEQHEPRQRHRRESQPGHHDDRRPGRDDRAAGKPFPYQPGRHHQHHDDRRDRSLGERPQRQGGGPADERGGALAGIERIGRAARLEGAKPPQDCRGDRQVEQRVHDRQATDDRLHETRRQNDRRIRPGATAGDPRCRVADGPAHRDRRQGRRQAHRERADAEHLGEQRGDPEIQRRLHEPRFAVEVHHEPIVIHENLARDFAVGGLAVVPQRSQPEPGQRHERGEERAQKRRAPGDPGRNVGESHRIFPFSHRAHGVPGTAI